MPPRTVEAELAFWSAIEELAALEPAFVSVTCGAGGTTRDLTLAVVRRLARERGLEAVPHVTATGFTREGLVELLAEARAGGADNVLALRGDPPRGQSTWTRARGRRAELAGADRARRRGRASACSAPPTRSRTRTRAAGPSDLAHLRAKVDAGVRVLVTQLFFDNDDYRRFVERCAPADRRAGAAGDHPGHEHRPDRADDARSAARASRRRCGASSSARQDDPRAVAELGVAYATAQAAELLADGAPGVHLYTLNRSPATRAIVSALRAHGALPGRRGLSRAGCAGGVRP